jgi:DNA polymerase III epsilon subunit-like protein
MAYSTRKSAIQKAREYQASRAVFLDTETTGLDARAEIIEICVMDHSGEILVDTLVKPTRPIPSDATLIHGITNQMVQQAPSWPEVWPLVQAAILGRYIGIYNADFDLRMVKQSHLCHAIAWDFPVQRVFDVMKIYSEYQGNSRWVSLDVAGRQSGISLPNSHRARADTDLLRMLFLHLASRIP